LEIDEGGAIDWVDFRRFGVHNEDVFDLGNGECKSPLSDVEAKA
jgi:hypothetical protein